MSKGKASVLAFILGLFSIGWSLTLMYNVIKTIPASDFVWFLFWGYIPISFFFTALAEYARGD
jgi:hypothetical protein